MNMQHRIWIAGLLGASLLSGAAVAAAIPAYIEKAVSDPARPADDVKRDAGRHPAELMQFAGIHPGMVVVDLLPGNGYFTRMFSKAVGPQGRVYAYFGLQYDARLKSQGKDPDNQFTDLKAAYPNLGVIHGDLVNFVTPEKVDLVWTSDNYHDMHTKAYATDPVAVDKAIFASLKPGGIFIDVDHRAVKGAGAGAPEALHRMDEDIAKQEIESAGFKLVAESKILTRPSDDDSKRIFETGEHDNTDQMVLKFRKP
jgi:predicted methyltransferase